MMHGENLKENMGEYPGETELPLKSYTELSAFATVTISTSEQRNFIN